MPPRLTATSRQAGPFCPNTRWSPPLTFKNFPSGGQQQGYSSKQAIENFIHVDSAVVPLTPQRAGLTLLSWMQVFVVVFLFLFFLNFLRALHLKRSLRPFRLPAACCRTVRGRWCWRGCSFALGGGTCEWVLVPELRVDRGKRRLRPRCLPSRGRV